MYIVWFQTPGDADAVLGADVEKTMRFFMRQPAEQPATDEADRRRSEPPSPSRTAEL